MPLMNWDQSLDIGVEKMNAEHRDILDAMNIVYDGANAGQSGPAMMAKIARLGDITTRHFADEEAYLARIGYPELEIHKGIHKKLLDDFAVHAQAIAAAGGVPTSAFFTFLRLWLSAHIKCIDLKYGNYAKSAQKAA
ncbi:bacteriohemerythrin [Novosphingobium sp. JCM 18896]|uniref:bacteriohemerythrin n=1 Tax=Novosphingobium sp. JCM 18896 TaxID=2989731 RepID=UPI002221817C|nr:hemerythrin family protein [Novosphingobium sp. JCM 18896]